MDLSLVGFTTAVMVSAYVATDRKWASVLAGLAGFCTYKFVTQRESANKAQKAKAETPPPEKKKPPAKRKVVAFDFDRCLMTKHWWGTYRNAPLKDINPGPADFAHRGLGNLLEELLSRPEVNVAVASFGRGDVIRKAIDSVLRPELSERVFITTPGDYPPFVDGQSMGNKNTQLQEISNKFSTPIQDIIFFDDDKKNISCGLEYGINAQWSAPFCEDHDHLIYEHLAR